MIKPSSADELEAAIAHVGRALSRCLPAGTTLTRTPSEVSPAERYWLIHRGARFVALLPQRLSIAAVPGLEALRRRVESGALTNDELGALAIGIAAPPATPWLAARDGKSAAAIIVNRRRKDIVLPVEPSSGTISRVIKLPRGEIVTRNCAREHALLTDLAAAGMRLGPTPLARDDARAAFHQEHVAGEHPRDLSMAALIRWPIMLAGAGTTTPAAQAQRLRARAEAMSLPDGLAAALEARLDRVTDQTEVASGITHGDFTLLNLIRGPDRQVRAIDWEFGGRDGVGFLDLIRLCYWRHDGSARTLPEFVSGRIGERMRRFHGVAFPGGRPRLDDLIYLTFCEYYLNRAEMYGHDVPYLRHLGGILRDPTPL